MMPITTSSSTSVNALVDRRQQRTFVVLDKTVLDMATLSALKDVLTRALRAVAGTRGNASKKGCPATVGFELFLCPFISYAAAGVRFPRRHAELTLVCAAQSPNEIATSRRKVNDLRTGANPPEMLALLTNLSTGRR
jgi:hypothetical protein